LATILLPIVVCSQSAIDTSHFIIYGDSLIAYRQPYIAISDTGTNNIWDFSLCQTDSNDFRLLYYFPKPNDTSTYYINKDNCNYHYYRSSDSIYFKGFETTLSKIECKIPIPIMKYPFNYQDTIFSTFIAQGEYSNIQKFDIIGNCMSVYSAAGQLKTPQQTFQSSKLIHTQLNYRTLQNNLQSIHANKYQWYINSCRYPIIEQQSITILNGNDTILFEQAFYCPQVPNTTTHNLDSIESDLESDTAFVNATYLPNPVTTNLNISYELTRDADIFFSLHYNGGSVMYTSPLVRQQAGYYTHTINMSSWQTGLYVLYIYVDNLIISQNIIKI